MAISKIIYKSSAQDTGTVWMDVTQKTVTAGTMLNGTTALKNDGTDITGNIASKTSSDLTASTLTVTAPAGYYASNATKTLTDANLIAENIKKDISIFGVTGSYEGGGSSTTVIVPEQSVTVNSQYNTVSYLSPLVDGEDYIITINGVQQTETAWSPGGNTVILYTSNSYLVFEWTGSTLYLDANSSSVYGSYTIKIEQQSGGGSSGLEYETGTWTPASDIARPTINFTNTHSTRPFSIVISDVTESDPAANSMIYWTVASWYDAFNSVARGTNSSQVYGGIRWAYSTSSSYSANGTNIQYLTGGSTQTYMDYVMTSSSFYPYGNSSSYNWRSGRTYKWIAVWKPTS